MDMEYFDIFIGGPMGEQSPDGAGLTISEHLPNMVTAIKNIAGQLNPHYEQLRINVFDPVQQDVGNIPDHVFSMIDRAELGIFDLSNNSPNVMYELTLMHALGKPVIPVSLKLSDDAVIPFYLNHDYAVLVSDFKVATLAEELMPYIQASLEPSLTGSDRAWNPITNFYRMPLLELSATTGLATGYVHNFIRHTIKETNSVFEKNRELKKIIVLKPSSLNATSAIQMRVTDQLDESGIKVELVGAKDGQVYADRDHVRGQMLLYKAGNYIFDVPAPLNAQKSSPRYRRLRRRPQNQTTAQKRQADALVDKVERQMIDRFFEVLQHLVGLQPDTNPDRIDFMTEADFIKLVERES